MFEVKTRSKESWGPLADCGDREFKSLINQLHAKDAIKTHLKRVKKLKTYKVTFEKRWYSEKFEIQAQDDYSVSTAAKQYFKDNEQTISFKEQTRNQWADGYAGYDTISFVKVK